MENNEFNPYAGNILIDKLRPILSRDETLAMLARLPIVPSDIAKVPRHIRAHCLYRLRDLHIPSLEEGKLADTIDLMLRDSLHRRNPKDPTTWLALRGEASDGVSMTPSLGSILMGLPGTGKTSACRNVLKTYGQTILHDSFPGMARPLTQVVWLSCDVPASGKSADLASALMTGWDCAAGTRRFEHSLGLSRPKGSVMLEEWRKVASAHFLGILHLDEIQNLFRLPSLKQRRKTKNGSEDYQLSIVEDECLKFILNLYNKGHFAILCSGTPDGMTALKKRTATTQRLTTAGAHHFHELRDAKDKVFRTMFLPELMRYQYVANPLEVNDDFAELILKLSGGIYRIIIALWIAAHRVAFERMDTDELRISDFTKAADTYLAPLKPAIEAVRSRDPDQIRRFGDLLNLEDDFWASI